MKINWLFLTLIISIAAVAGIVFFVSPGKLGLNKGLTDQKQGPEAQELVFISDNKILALKRPASPKVIFDLNNLDRTAAISAKINSILPSPERQKVVVLLAQGEEHFQEDLPYFEGGLKSLVIDSEGQVISEHSIFAKEKINSLAYFWKGDDIYFRASVLGQQGIVSTNHFRLNSGGVLSADDYDQIVKNDKLEIVFSDFSTAAYRKTNQTLAGDRIYLDRDQITRARGGSSEIIIEAGKFFEEAGSLFGSFQISPDEKKIAFNKDVDSCLWPTKNKASLNELYVYDLGSSRQVKIAESFSPLNFVWLDNETIAFDQGLSAAQEILLLSLDPQQKPQNINKIDQGSLFFPSRAPLCEP